MERDLVEYTRILGDQWIFEQHDLKKRFLESYI